MNRPKPSKGWGKDVPIEDPGLLRDTFRLLRDQQTEFPIKVEGTSTLPYTSQVVWVDMENMVTNLRLVRPLPHELLKGAEFRATFAVDEQRFEALLIFLEREEYLTYRFQLPQMLFYADRREHKRFPFRPRESAFVTAQDGGVPGIGVAGPLVNVGMGGLAMRVDRVLKLDDGMRIPPAAAPLERGKLFARIRLQDLPKLPFLELSGVVSHLSERGGEIILGFQFVHLQDAQLQSLRDCLALREQVFRKTPGAVRDSPTAGYRAPVSGGEATRRAAESPAGREAPIDPPGRPTLPGADPLALLARRTVQLAVALGDPAHRDLLLPLLREQGFHRIHVVPSLADAGALWRTPEPPAALLMDISLGGTLGKDAVSTLRALERQVQVYGDIPLVVFAEQVDDGALMNLGPRTRLLPLRPEGADAELAWAEAVAYAAGLME